MVNFRQNNIYYVRVCVCVWIDRIDTDLTKTTKLPDKYNVRIIMTNNLKQNQIKPRHASCFMYYSNYTLPMPNLFDVYSNGTMLGNLIKDNKNMSCLILFRSLIDAEQQKLDMAKVNTSMVLTLTRSNTISTNPVAHAKRKIIAFMRKLMLNIAHGTLLIRQKQDSTALPCYYNMNYRFQLVENLNNQE